MLSAALPLSAALLACSLAVRAWRAGPDRDGGWIPLTGWAVAVAVAEAGRAAGTPPGVAAAVFAVGIVCLGVGLLRLLPPALRRPGWARTVLDGWLYAASAALVFDILVLAPSADPKAAVVALTFVTLDVTILLLLLRVAGATPAPQRRVLVVAAVGAGLVATGDLLPLLALNRGSTEVPAAVAVTVGGYLVLAAAPWAGPPPQRVRPLRFTFVQTALPTLVIAVAAVFALAPLFEGRAPDLPVVWLATTIVGVGIARQILTLLENDELVREVSEREAMFRTLVQESNDVILVLSGDGTVRYVSPAVQRVLGHRPEDLVGRTLKGILHPDEIEALTEQVRAFVDAPDEETTRLDAHVRAGDGTWRVTETTLSRNSTSVIANVRDVSDRVALQDQLAHLAFHDALTGLPNRAMLTERIAHAMRTRPRDGGAVAVVFFDLDGFKAVNDSAGHAVGDALLQQAAARMRALVPPGATMARFGGDEFALLLEGRAAVQGAAETARRIIAALSQPFELGGPRHNLAASAGLALGEDAADDHELLRNADLAMYAAKTQGKGRVAAYHPELHAEALHRVELTSRLDRALSEQGLALLYQPVVDLASMRVVAVEALVRWRSDAGSLASPVDLIRTAEEYGRIEEVGRWVLETALTQSSSWRRDGHEIDVAVNLSARQLDADLGGLVADTLQLTGVPADALILEMTESVLVDDLAAASRRLAGLKATGVRVALDDFGTGYSSLGYLRDLPVDILKVDRTFVAGLGASRDGSALAGAVVRLGLELGLVVSAEGVETPRQLEALRALGCHRAQGYLYSGATDAQGIADLLAAGPLAPASVPHPETAVSAG